MFSRLARTRAFPPQKKTKESQPLGWLSSLYAYTFLPQRILPDTIAANTVFQP